MLDLSQFEALTFDCYGTLIDWETGILSALHPILSTHGKTLDDAILLKLYGDFEQLAEEGEFHPYRQVLQSVVRRLGTQLGFSASDEEAQSLPDSLATWKPWPDTVSALQRLKSQFRLAIISNVDDDLFAATRPQLQVEFDEVVTAQEAQAYKPSLRIFELALSRLGTPRDRILHVGQSIFHDVVPAQRLGLSTVWVNRPSARAGVGAVKAAEGKPDLEVSNLSALVDLL
jgi:2-haloacid dehalogenase